MVSKRYKTTRVLQVVSCMNRGGIETFLMNIYRKIDRTKIQFDFLCCSNLFAIDGKCDYDDEILQLGGKIFTVDDPKTVGLNKFIKQVKGIMYERQYDVVHSHMFLLNGIILKIAKDVGIIKRISHSHTSLDCNKTSIKRLVYRIYMKKLIKKNATALFGCSNKANQYLYGKHYMKTNVKVINNGIEPKSFVFDSAKREKIRNELGINNKFVIGHIGRFSPEKNHKFIIDIFKTIKNEKCNSCLMLIGGDNGIESNIKDKAQKEGVFQDVNFMGMRTDISDLLQAMDVFVFPSIYEGLPVTLIEAQASGIKCIVSDIITDEVKITNLIEFISLDKSAEFWAKKIMIYNNDYKRLDTCEEIMQAGFDIKRVSSELEQMYISN
ncbi:glycosyltransferase family 1 protein [Clostridium estertheticum]|uniref:glycosyltransferase family 1 protein n=1 Tax=Clostridium estertheticum TaxID=238834 RepID=UPI001C7D954A|nr:glycosyltransferase family 1 protein [Clostridium estertheticum]MBX4270562.1 glycosyltransferase family 1 protein [Clostridium estertheticum]WLC80088.1 glycosyltransferase family 1 protein [Clostridium estertheticum]